MTPEARQVAIGLECLEATIENDLLETEDNEMLKPLIPILRLYLEAVKEVPEEKEVCQNCALEMISEEQTEKEKCLLNIGFNACRSQLLPLIVQRDRRIAELDKQNTELVQEAVRHATKYEALSSRVRDVEVIAHIVFNEAMQLTDIDSKISYQIAQAISAWIREE